MNFRFREPSCRVFDDNVGIVNAYDMFVDVTKEGKGTNHSWFHSFLSDGDASSAARAVLFASGEQRPQHTSIVVGERNRGNVGTVLKLSRFIAMLR